MNVNMNEYTDANITSSFESSTSSLELKLSSIKHVFLFSHYIHFLSLAFWFKTNNAALLAIW